MIACSYTATCNKIGAEKKALPFGPRGVYSSMNMERSTAMADPALPDDVATLQAMIRELIATLHKEQREREGVQQRLDLLLRKLYGSKAERFDPNQPWLLPELAPDAMPPATAEPPENEDAVVKPKRKGHGRKPLPEDLPRTRIEHKLEHLCERMSAEAGGEKKVFRRSRIRWRSSTGFASSTFIPTISSMGWSSRPKSSCAALSRKHCEPTRPCASWVCSVNIS